ncbi:MAG: LacI family DNA-binding transcriptional regulator [Phycisphaerales bacterium]|jgi:DNA-binding LacI/PurR family transcriptional regulator|nr:LacI family DNA-binding transcriptional regulator [Phycisphaerales bacterium]
MGKTTTKPALTQRRLAEALNISYLTVNRALAGHSAVSDKTSRRVLEAADRMGYRVNHAARSLKMQKTFSIGLVGCNTPHSFWADILAEFEVRCRAKDYHVMVCHRLAGESSNRCAEFLVERRVDGIVIAPDDTTENPDQLKRILGDTPVLFLNSAVAGIASAGVGTNSRAGMKQLTEYLIELGHRDFCYISGPQCDYTAQQRHLGFREAVAGLQQGGSGRIRIEHAKSFCQEDGAQITRDLLAGGQALPTAMVCGNDALAIGASIELARAGVRIPQDVSVAGYAGMREATFLPAPLTTVSQPVFQLGRLCAQLILARIADPDGPTAFTEIEDTLTIRESTGSPRATALN